MRKSIVVTACAVLSCFFISTTAQAVTGDWTGLPAPNNLWSNSAAWVDGIIPNGQGDTAQYLTTQNTPAASSVAINDLADVTVGTLRLSGNTNHSMQFTPRQNIKLNQDGAGPGHAAVINDAIGTVESGTPPSATSNISIFLNPAGGTNPGAFLLEDELWLINNSNSTRSNGSIQIRGPLKGTGNIYMENATNDITAGQIQWTNNQSSGIGAGGFGGDIYVRKGAVTFTRGDVFTPASKMIYLGAEGMGDATLAFTGGGVGGMEYQFTSVANTGGTTRFIAASTSAGSAGDVVIRSTFTNFGNIFLEGPITFENRSTSGATLVVGDRIFGAAGFTKTGPGDMRLTNANTFSGGTTVEEGALIVTHTDAIVTPYGTHAATDGTLGAGGVTVKSGLSTANPTKVVIESSLAAINVIADTATVRLAGCDDAFGCVGGTPDVPDGGFLLLDSGINETVSALLLSFDGGTTYVAQAPGTYGASGSGAAHELDEYFAGFGILTVAPAGLPGDFNNDGKVDAGDYVTWRKNDGANATLPNDGGAGDQAARYTLWRTNFGKPPGSGAELVDGGQVPEPGALLLMATGVLAMCAGQRRRADLS